VLIAAMNPCPCGFFGDEHRSCGCTPTQIAQVSRQALRSTSRSHRSHRGGAGPASLGLSPMVSLVNRPLSCASVSSPHGACSNSDTAPPVRVRMRICAGQRWPRSADQTRMVGRS
jgi:hypothetical protein